MPSSLRHATLQSLHAAVESALQQQQPLNVVVPQFRAQQSLLSQLPAAFGPALENILQRIEAGALFTEESCSFSQADLAAALGVWLEKADLRLG